MIFWFVAEIFLSYGQQQIPHHDTLLNPTLFEDIWNLVAQHMQHFRYNMRTRGPSPLMQILSERSQRCWIWRINEKNIIVYAGSLRKRWVMMRTIFDGSQTFSNFPTFSKLFPTSFWTKLHQYAICGGRRLYGCQEWQPPEMSLNSVAESSPILFQNSKSYEKFDIFAVTVISCSWQFEIVLSHGRNFHGYHSKCPHPKELPSWFVLLDGRIEVYQKGINKITWTPVR